MIRPVRSRAYGTDGDTIRILMPDGTSEPVRLIGINAPEDGSLLAQEATSYMEELVLGKKVRMVIDVSDRDRFDRLLRYVYVGDLFVNEEMVRVGLAIARRYEPDTAIGAKNFTVFPPDPHGFHGNGDGVGCES